MKRHTFTAFIQQLDQLSPQQWKQLDGALALARPASVLALIEAANGPGVACPRCAATRVHRHGSAHGLRRYRCLACRRTFNALTGTPLARLRKRGKWLTFLDCMLDSRSVRAAASRAGVHRNTSFRWRHRFLHGAKHDRTLPLAGVVEADETYLLESQKGARELDRPARRRGGHAATRGISHEHVCILVARDRSGSTIDFVTGRAPLTCTQLAQHLPPVLATDALLMSDGHPAYRAFSRAAGMAHESVNLRAGMRVKGALHIQNVNSYHSRFKTWLQRFHGVATKYLSNYLGWRWAIDGNRISSPEMFLAAALKGAAQPA